MSKQLKNIDDIKFNAQGLVPVITQDAKTGAVLMQAYMNQEALERSVEKGYMVYWSRSRNELWEKGSTSGQTQQIVALYTDCDCDSILAKVIQNGGGACHTGEYSCFHNSLLENDSANANGAAILYELASVIADRRERPQEGSYTNYLFDKGIDKILKKVGEEAAETIIAAKNADADEIRYEVADLFYHVLVMLEERGVAIDAIFSELENRR